MDENKFWLCMWSVVATAFLTFAAVVALYNYSTYALAVRAVVEATRAGADPMKARCAVDSANPVICAALAVK